MAKDKVERRLAAIFAADMVGYSSLMEADEEGTIARQKACHNELIDPKIAAYDGRVVKLMGDGMLVEFASVVDAVHCAVEVQMGMAEREADAQDNQRIQYRVGINLGDIVIDGDDILGDGVNLAARIEGISSPGGICLSDEAYRQVKGKIDHRFEDAGERQLKNIERPVRIWRWAAGPAQSLPASQAQALKLPDEPSIAVLPFNNMSGDPEQEFLADGLAEDIITALSKISELFVIARNSTFAYKGGSPDIRQVARDLGVRTVLEGSVRKAGNRVRITAQLIDAEKGAHLWAERYDREIVDIFDLQDEITQEIVTALQVRLTEGEQARLRRRQTHSITAWELYLQAQRSLRRFTLEDNAMAQDLIERALELDPNFAAAWGILAFTHLADARVGWSGSNAASLEKGVQAAQKGLAVDEDQSESHAMLGGLWVLQRRYEEGIEAGRHAIEISPNTADHYVWYAITMNFVGRADEAISAMHKAMRLCPFYPDFYLGILAQSYRLLGRFDEAIAADKERLERNPENAFSDIRLAAVFAELGRDDEAKFHVGEALKKNPSYSLKQLRDTDPYQDEAEMARYVDLLRLAGLPE
jgi:adenylate cyclase